MKITKIAQAIPREFTPTATTPYIYVRRAVDPTSASGGKEYIVAVYMYSDSNYSVIAWHGSLNSRSLRPQFKGRSRTRGSAINQAEIVMRDKVYDPRKNYIFAPSPDQNRIRGVYRPNMTDEEFNAENNLTTEAPTAPSTRANRPDTVQQHQDRAVRETRERGEKETRERAEKRLELKLEEDRKKNALRQEQEEKERQEQEWKEMTVDKALSPENRHQYSEDLEEDIALLSKNKFNLMKKASKK